MFNNLKNHRAERARRKMLSQGLKKSTFKKWRFAAISAVVLAMAVLVYAICFAYKSPIVPQIVTKNKMAQVQIVSPFDFSYVSEIQTQASRERNAERIPPIYKTNLSIISAESKNINKLVSILDEKQAAFNALPEEDKKSNKFFDELSAEIRKNTSIAVSPDDIRTIYEKRCPTTAIAPSDKCFSM